MTARVEVRDGILHLSGAIDAAGAESCEAAGRRLIDGLAGSGPLDCDLSALTSGSSLTAAVLMSWHRAAARRGRALRLQALPARLRAILVAGNLLPVFTDQP